MEETEFNEEEIKFTKISKIIRYLGTNHLPIIVKHFYEEHPYNKEGLLSLVDFSLQMHKDEPKKKNTKGVAVKTGINVLKSKYSASFCEKEMHLAFDKGEFKNFDMTSITEIWVKLIENQEFSTKFTEEMKLIKQIKDIRNELSHYGNTINKDVANKYFDEVKENINELNLLTNGWNEEYNQSSIDAVLKIWKENIQVIVPITPDLVTVFIKKARVELKNFYKETEITEYGTSILFEEDFPIDEVFTPVIMKTSNTEIDKYDEILQIRGNINENCHPAVIVSGHAGYGKTTMCKKFTHDWCYKTESYCSSKYDLLLHIEIKNATEKEDCFFYLRSVLLPQTLGSRSKTDIKTFLDQCNLLFILDGYDERSHVASKLIQNIFETFPKQKIVITTRPSCLEEVQRNLKCNNILCSKVQINGFSSVQADDFLGKIIEKTLKNKDKKSGENYKAKNPGAFKEYLKKIGPSLGELLRMPIIYIFLIYLWIKGKEKDKPLPRATFTCLYEQVFDKMKDRARSKMVQYNKYPSESDASKVLDEVLDELAKSCYQLAIKERFDITEDDVTKIEKRVSNNECYQNDTLMSVLENFLHIKPNVRRKQKSNTGRQIEFIHKTQFEYLISVSLLSNDKDELTKSLEKLMGNIESETFTNVIGFLIGLISSNSHQRHHGPNQQGTKQLGTKLPVTKKDIEDIFYLFKIKYSSDNYAAWWRILSESQLEVDLHSDLEFNKFLCIEIEQVLNHSTIWKLDDSNVIGALCLFKYLKQLRINELIINITEQFSHDILNFDDVWNSIKKSKKLKAELHFLKDWNNGKDETKSNNVYLNSLKRFGTLNKFTGFIGGDDIKLNFKDYTAIKDVTIKIVSYDSLEKFVTAVSSPKSLKILTILFDGMTNQKYPANKYMSLDAYINAKLTIIFKFFKDKNDLDWCIEILKKLKPKNRCIERVVIDKCQLEADVVWDHFIPKVGDIIVDNLKVYSPEDPDPNHSARSSNLKFIFEWI